MHELPAVNDPVTVRIDVGKGGRELGHLAVSVLPHHRSIGFRGLERLSLERRELRVHGARGSPRCAAALLERVVSWWNLCVVHQHDVQRRGGMCLKRAVHCVDDPVAAVAQLASAQRREVHLHAVASFGCQHRTRRERCVEGRIQQCVSEAAPLRSGPLLHECYGEGRAEDLADLVGARRDLCGPVDAHLHLGPHLAPEIWLLPQALAQHSEVHSHHRYAVSPDHRPVTLLVVVHVRTERRHAVHLIVQLPAIHVVVPVDGCCRAGHGRGWSLPGSPCVARDTRFWAAAGLRCLEAVEE
mmetsp:Transcript_15290/g.35787  ORF Transcript_15290/g.35787 Transcript_15290/m.35787 type:complete len:299 (+) Transcript_15290:282-1178(+)